MEIVTGSTGEAHVTPIDDAVRNSNLGYYDDHVVLSVFRNLEAVAITANEVRVYGGYGMNQGRLFKIDESDYDSCVIENGAQGLKRADLIVARYTMNAQTGFEDISLVVIKGASGSTYVDPSYTSGNINEGDTQDDFPLYRVKINGIVIEAVEPLFEALPLGGRLGEIEEKIDNHIADTEDPHRITWTESQELVPMSVSDKLNVQFGKIAKAVSSLIAHIADKSNPHEVSGNQLGGVVPITKGGTGATTAAGALQALGVPSDVANAMSKDVYTDTSTDAIKPAKGGTGRISWTAGTVLVGNGTAAATERSIDSTTGGIANSSALVTSGALNATKTALQTSFQDGVDTIYNAVASAGITPASSTPSACATAIGNLRKTPYIGTYTFPANDTGGTKDLGLPHSIRYVNASNVYNKGKTDAQAVTWTDTVEMYATGSVGNKSFYAYSSFPLKNLISFKIKTVTHGNNLRYYFKADSYATPTIGTSYTVPSDATKLEIMAYGDAISSVSGSIMNVDMDIELTYQAKILR